MLTRKTASALLAISLLSSAAFAQVTGPTVNIKDFGAVPDGKTMNTLAIQKAIDDLAAKGGGTVIIPAAVPPAPDAPKPVPQAAPATDIVNGAFISGAIFLKPGVNLHLDKGAILKGSTDTKDYPTMKTRIEGHFQDWLPALINADQIEHLKIDGEGVLDGSGTPFYAAFRRDRGTNLGTPRPRLLFISKCKDASISGLHLFNSGFWNLHLYNCDGVTIDGLEISAPPGSPSTDGIDVDSSRNITIKNTSIANNDDCIALKGSKGVNALSDKDSPPDEHIRLFNVTCSRGGSLLTCGSEATLVRDVVVEHCTIAGPNTGGISLLRLKLRTDTPQTYEDIHYKDITLDGAGALIAVAAWSQYEDLQGQPRPTHTVRNISISDVKGTFGSFGTIRGGNGDTLDKITFENIDVKLRTAPAANAFQGVKELSIKNVMINGNEFKP